MKISKKAQIISSLIFALVIAAFVYYEIDKSRHDMLNYSKEQAESLVNLFGSSISNTIMANEEIEHLMIKRLNTAAKLLAESENNFKLKHTELMSRFEISHAAIIDENGKILNSAFGEQNQQIPYEIIEEIENQYDEDKDFSDVGIISFPFDSALVYAAASKRVGGKGWALICIDAENLLEFRKKIGIGRKIQDIAVQKNIIYAVLQDSIGIIAASNMVQSLSSVGRDSFIDSVYNYDKTNARLTCYNYKAVFEAVASVKLDGGIKLLCRIALSLDETQKIQQRASIRTILLGTVIYLIGILLILFASSRRRLQALSEEHQKQNKYMEMILNGIADPVTAIDTNNKISICNPAAEEFLAVDAKNIIGKHYSSLFDDAAMLINPDNSNKLPQTYIDLTMINKKGVRKYYNFSVSYYSYDQSTDNFAICVFHDITSSKQLAEEMNRKEKLFAMGELAAGVAHEIRNPLNAISIIAQRFQYEFEPKDDEETYNRLVSTIRKEVDRVNGIIKQFMQFAKPAKLKTEDIDINIIIKETIDLMSSTASNANINIVIDLNETEIITGDKDKLKQVLINLCQNAVEAMSLGGELCIRSYKEHSSQFISVRDTGEGISEKVKAKIFNLYFSSKPQGNGLGLSIVHQIISEHGGRIFVESQEGMGSEFIIELPAEVSSL